MNEMSTSDTEELREMIQKQVLRERGFGLVWMSAGNSYFTENVIKKIIDFVTNNFQKSIIMAPDEPAEHTFKALGYTGNKMKKKARLNANLLQNRARRLVNQLGSEKNSVHIVEWVEEIIPNKFYQQRLQEMLQLFYNNKEFQNDAYETTKLVLQNKANREINLDEAKKEGVHYLLKELSFCLASPNIFQAQKITYIYHKEWPIFEKLIKGHYDGVLREKLGFLLFK